MKKELLDKVLRQITEDVMNGDVTAIEELITDIPDDTAQAFLPEAQVLEELDKKRGELRSASLADAQEWLDKGGANNVR